MNTRNLIATTAAAWLLVLGAQAEDSTEPAKPASPGEKPTPTAPGTVTPSTETPADPGAPAKPGSPGEKPATPEAPKDK